MQLLVVFGALSASHFRLHKAVVAVESRSIIVSYSNIAYVNLLIQDEQRALSRSIVASRTGLTTLREINGAAGYPPRCRSILASSKPVWIFLIGRNGYPWKLMSITNFLAVRRFKKWGYAVDLVLRSSSLFSN